ncbi:MAG: tail fiber domain-containing protein [Tannerella sp.]|jgi:hypothetical protein|nr:tail fiber domain-containing protein [Tannerella sp.]
MKKIIFTFVFVACLAQLSAQIKVNSSGDTYVSRSLYLESSSSNVLGTTGNFPVVFKINGYLSGSTGNHAQGNVSFGYQSLQNMSSGTYNTAIGSSALYSNTGNYNSAMGSNALYFNTSGTGNTATGVCALYQNTTGSYNTASGNNAMNPNTTGSYNTAMGTSALYNNTVGSLNTAIGYGAGVNSPNNLTNTTSIGYAAYATASDQVRIGNNLVTSIGGYANWSNISDGRAKKNIRADVPGLDFINLLQPVTYNLDLDAMDSLLGIDKAKKEELEKDMPRDLKEKNEKAKQTKQEQVQTGFVAQDVEKTAKSVGYDFSGVNVDESGIYSLSYAEFVVPLVKAVQELSAQNEQLQQQINELKANSVSLRSSSPDGTGTTGTDNPATAQCKLYQNAPNPFNQSTQIRYYLPQDVKTVYLYIYNLQGAQIKQFRITQRGEGLQVIDGSELAAGMYLYALIADGQEVDTKRMILTK